MHFYKHAEEIPKQITLWDSRGFLGIHSLCLRPGSVRNADRKCKAFSLRSKIGFPRVGNQIWASTPQNRTYRAWGTAKLTFMGKQGMCLKPGAVTNRAYRAWGGKSDQMFRLEDSGTFPVATLYRLEKHRVNINICTLRGVPWQLSIRDPRHSYSVFLRLSFYPAPIATNLT